MQIQFGARHHINMGFGYGQDWQLAQTNKLLESLPKDANARVLMGYRNTVLTDEGSVQHASEFQRLQEQAQTLQEQEEINTAFKYYADPDLDFFIKRKSES